MNDTKSLERIESFVGSSKQTIYKLADIASITQLDESLMPKFPLTEEELVDLVSYLERLRK